MSTVQEILAAMDTLTFEQLRIVKIGADSRLADDDNDPALLAALKEAVAYADVHPEKQNAWKKFDHSSPNGFPNRNHSAGHNRSHRDRFAYRARQASSCRSAWQSYAGYRFGVEPANLGLNAVPLAKEGLLISRPPFLPRTLDGFYETTAGLR